MRHKEDLRRKLLAIDGRGYKAYKDIRGEYDFADFQLFIDHVQGDPFASPSMLRARVPQKLANFPSTLFSNKDRRIACEDYLIRTFDKAIRRVVEGRRGSGKSGLIAIDRGGQEVLERTAMVVDKEMVEARFVMGLPAAGRRVLGRQAIDMFFSELPQIVKESLFYRTLDSRDLENYVNIVEDQAYLRRQLPKNKLVAFIANNSVLPRRSGVDDRPLPRPQAIPFVSPPELEVTFELPNRGSISGMGIPEGVTLIVGGGYHGKSTLLKAIERGVYNHLPGDGREFAVAIPEAVKIRAEDGRRVEKVNISPFIQNLPYGEDTSRFSTDNASGSTSQASNIIEALEVGAKLLLIDEDTSATNFMIRDVRMQKLVARDKEPITPFIDKVKLLYRDLGVSSIIILGGSGDYFDVADTILMMNEYEPYEVTDKAREIAEEYQTHRQAEGGANFGEVTPRIPIPNSLNPSRGRRDKVQAKGLNTILFGRDAIDLQYVPQIVDYSQTRAIGSAIYYALDRYIDGHKVLKQIVTEIMSDIETRGLDILSPFKGQHPGDYAKPRPFEIATAINRLRTLRVKQKL